MTINVEELNYNILENIINNLENIKQIEADLIIQMCIHVLSGNKNKHDILDVFKKQVDRFIEKKIESSFPKEIDQYKILKYYVNKTQ
jgi:dihydropteroate synthase